MNNAEVMKTAERRLEATKLALRIIQQYHDDNEPGLLVEALKIALDTMREHCGFSRA